ncbi:MAG: FAD-binding protein [Oscillospiraceae bacterium]|nr:FAD-binding protein [Oscillospiraceae bacterium]
MKVSIQNICGQELPVITCKTAVLGSGAAGWAAAWRLAKQPDTDPVLLCAGAKAGTSRNAGSDKQTYYRLGAVGTADCVEAMADDLFGGGAADGDHALCEAALSTRCFYSLCELGVPFPCDPFGRYVGYKTDHDPAGRASSVGPYTSRAMTEKLEAAARAAGVPVFDDFQAVKLLVENGAVKGLLGMTAMGSYCACLCNSIVMATGGPADIWQHSVFPESQTGASGLAFEVGAAGKNLTEWQFGLASLAPRWNVSGTYMQALPRFFSVDEKGDQVDFLLDEMESGLFADLSDLLTSIFLKGYQWPFDARRAAVGSSRIDLAVLRQQQLGRRVYLDFTREPVEPMPQWSVLSDEARIYLEKAGACIPSPIARLAHMNQPAVDFYAEHGVDLTSEPLEIGVCAQHNNGGLAVDHWWRTAVEGLFCVGEAAATHGVRRPGGSALNAGQVGALRASQYIAAKRSEAAAPAVEELLPLLEKAVAGCTALDEAVLSNVQGLDVNTAFAAARARMSAAGGIQRAAGALDAALAETRACLAAIGELKAASRMDLPAIHRLRQVYVCQCMVLASMADYAKQVGVSRGSATYADADGVYQPEPARENGLPRADETRVQELCWADGACTAAWRAVRPIPANDTFFENVWREFRVDGNIR